MCWQSKTSGKHKSIVGGGGVGGGSGAGCGGDSADRYKDAKTPEDLYSMIPSVHPTESEFIHKARPSDCGKWASLPDASIMDGVYKMENVHILKELEKWDWKDMAHFFK